VVRRCFGNSPPFVQASPPRQHRAIRYSIRLASSPSKLRLAVKACTAGSMEDQKAFIVGVSGCSSSGKTTLARLLRDIFPNTMILHEDDFYKPEAE
jgi:pantothenate kinase-related protein Tda10